MKKLIIYLTILFFGISLNAQNRPLKNFDRSTPVKKNNLERSNTQFNQNLSDQESSEENSNQSKFKKAPIDLYRIVSVNKDTTYVDTTLTIKKDYKYNYLRKDNFGLLAFNNDGHTYQMLDFGLNNFEALPQFGFKGKHFNYLQIKDINYYSVATPLTELYFKTTMKKGQSLDAFITLNLHERLNFSIAYKGLSSLGKYVNNASSTGNFRFTTNYQTEKSRYVMNMHITSQDMKNGENGGIYDTENFENESGGFTDRARLTVFLPDAESLLDGNRYFYDHHFRVNKNEAENNLLIDHQFYYENKYFEFKQPSIYTNVLTDNGVKQIIRFGDSYVQSNIVDEARSNRMYNKFGATYLNKTLGGFQFFVENFTYNHYYDKILRFNDYTIPSKISDQINAVGGKYIYQKNKWFGTAMLSKSISDQQMSTLDLQAQYSFGKNKLKLEYQNLNKIPDHTYVLFQSNYKHYNWFNNFENEKINQFAAKFETIWGNLALQYKNISDYLYFKQDQSIDHQLLVSPTQFSGSVNYLSLKLEKEFKVGKFALDNTVLYQKSSKNESILNVPEFITRNTLYYSDHFFKRALYIQTGFTFSYFTNYYADEYNPLIGDFFIQNDKKIGSFPMMDFFINAKVRQTRIYLKAEHFNSSFTGNKFYSSPTNPYKDFLIRFGLVWNFFQ